LFGIMKGVTPMKKTVFLVVVVLLVTLALASAAFASDGETHECHWESGRAFGQHVAEHAQMGMLGADHNPGNHQGFSLCVP
jgi:hypothetical protein